MASIRTRRVVKPCALALCAMLSFVGCGDDQWGEIEGVVKLNGQPIGPGRMILMPATEQHGGSMGMVAENGRYTVLSPGRKPGAAVGDYLVGIQDDFDPEAIGPRPKAKFPAKYADPATSGLKVTIEPGTRTFDFELAP